MSNRSAYEEFNNLLDNTEPCRVLVDKDGRPNDPEKWTGAWTDSTDPEVAAALCAGCHIIDECLGYALEVGEKNFIYGGTTGPQRKEMLARQRRSETTSHRFVKDANGTYKAT